MYELYIKHDLLFIVFYLRIRNKNIYDMISTVFSNWITTNDEWNKCEYVTIDVYQDKICINNKNQIKKITFTSVENLIYILIDVLSEPYKVIRNRNLVFFHGSVVAKYNSASLILAPTMQGKTTLCTYLSLMGYTYISDDLVLVDHNMNIYPLPTPIKVRKNNIFNNMHLVTNYNVFKTNDYSILTPKKQIDFSKVYSPQNAFFLNRDEKSENVKISELSSFNATNKFIVNGAYIDNVYFHITLSRKLAEKCKCYNVCYSDIREIINKINF